MINQKRCKNCGELFDIATNFDLCHKCRGFGEIKKIDINEVEWK